MRINFDRLSQLAGLPANGNRRSLHEGMSPMDAVSEEDVGNEGMDHYNEMVGGLDEEEAEKEREDEMSHLDEMIEVDEVMLVQELRRAKRIMNENKRRRLSESRRRNMFEAQLKQVIDEEVQNVMEEMNLTGQWVYGDRRPTRSRKGYSHQGSIMPGLGFRRR